MIKHFFWFAVLGLLLASCSTAPAPSAPKIIEENGIKFVETSEELSVAAADPMNITIKFVGNPPAFFKTAVLNAAKRWESVITQGLTGYTGLKLSANECGNIAATTVNVDDIVIFVSAADQGGSGGILASTRVCQGQFITVPSGRPGIPPLPKYAVPLVSNIIFDAADVGSSSTRFEALATQQIGRALGLGTFWNLDFFGLGLVKGSGTTKPTFTGANANREYKKLGGVGQIPLEARFSISTGAGAPLSIEPETYWSEKLGSELLTPVLGSRNQLSRITVGALADLGYKVNYLRADPYNLPK